MSYFNDKQVETLLKPINPNRVLSLGQSKGPALSYVAQHDIRAHLNRVFGFGRWSMHVKETAFMFDEQNKEGRWKACYRATVRLTICAPDGSVIAEYEDSHASGNMPQPDRADAHALALTIAVSTAMKRAATCLGDQFGLSLYNKGQTLPFVKGTLIGAAEAKVDDDVKILSMGEVEGGGMPEDEPATSPSSTVEGHPAIQESLAHAADDAGLAVDTETGEIAEDPEVAAEEKRLYLEGAMGELRAFAMLATPGDRILHVAKWKQENSALLSERTKIGAQEITLGVLADEVAAGKYSKKEEA